MIGVVLTAAFFYVLAVSSALVAAIVSLVALIALMGAAVWVYRRSG